MKARTKNLPEDFSVGYGKNFPENSSRAGGSDEGGQQHEHGRAKPHGPDERAPGHPGKGIGGHVEDARGKSGLGLFGKVLKAVALVFILMILLGSL